MATPTATARTAGRPASGRHATHAVRECPGGPTDAASVVRIESTGRPADVLLARRSGSSLRNQAALVASHLGRRRRGPGRIRTPVYAYPAGSASRWAASPAIADDNVKVMLGRMRIDLSARRGRSR
jgi:hypothetical protein